MTTAFPGGLDSFTNPNPTDPENSPSHSGQHQDANDAIEALETKVGIDGSAVTSSHSYKLAGITGSDRAASRAGAETLTNKTIDGDDNTIQDLALSTLKTILADASKFIVRDSLGAVTSSKSVPSGDVVGTSDTQTLSSKSLVQPYIGNFQSAQHNHSSEPTGGRLGTGSLIPGAVQPETLQPNTGSSWAWQAWTPTWTNVTIGDLTVTARYIQIGKTVHGRINVDINIGNSWGNNVTFTLPVTAVSAYSSFRFAPIGDVTGHDSGTGVYHGAIVLDASAASASVRWFVNPVGTEIQTTPDAVFVEASGDNISISFTYEAAETPQDHIDWILPQPAFITRRKPSTHIYDSFFMTLGAV